MKCLTRGMQTVTRWSAIHRGSLNGIWGLLVGHKRGPPRMSIQGIPRLSCDLFSFSSTFGQPVTGPHVGHSRRVALALGCIGGDALRVQKIYLSPIFQSSNRSFVGPARLLSFRGSTAAKRHRGPNRPVWRRSKALRQKMAPNVAIQPKQDACLVACRHHGVRDTLSREPFERPETIGSKLHWSPMKYEWRSSSDRAIAAQSAHRQCEPCCALSSSRPASTAFVVVAPIVIAPIVVVPVEKRSVLGLAAPSVNSAGRSPLSPCIPTILPLFRWRWRCALSPLLPDLATWPFMFWVALVVVGRDASLRMDSHTCTTTRTYGR